MADIEIHPKEYAGGFIVSKSLLEGEKTYGTYLRNGKKYTRNYHHVLKNGQGLSYYEVIRVLLDREYSELPMKLEVFDG